MQKKSHIADVQFEQLKVVIEEKNVKREEFVGENIDKEEFLGVLRREENGTSSTWEGRAKRLGGYQKR